MRGLLDDGSDPGEVLRLLTEPAGSVEHWGARALRRSLLATAEHTGRRIETYAGDPATTPFQLVVGARRGLADISSVRTRWQHATGAAPTQRQRPAPTTRAGPADHHPRARHPLHTSNPVDLAYADGWDAAVTPSRSRTRFRKASLWFVSQAM
ncbi:hypothetical protein STVIR_1939 [Streptomyces viridochromogenes Tue57]|uniref:Uncharacterized protein n=1 Tax=Streptomyces viridochromogenes Tue57 TaxID=1160705 RepID=L8PLD4_STRVR|nr:hypothetical protein STVIR_1939 [Streptomyces viridochromogenes Tue57]